MVQSATAFSSHQYINWNRYSSYRCIEPNLIDFSQSCISGTPPVRRRSTDSGTCLTPMPTSSSSSSTSSTQRHSVRFATLVCLAVSKCRVNTHNRGSTTVRLTSCLTGFDLTKQEKLLFMPHKQSSRIQTNNSEVRRKVILPPMVSALW